MRSLWLVFYVFVFILLSFRFQDFQRVQINGRAQGGTYQIIYYTEGVRITKAQVDSILTVIDNSLSLYKPNSLVNQFNTSVDGVIADEHFKKVVDKAIDTYYKTGGLFDITIFPLTAAWGFGPAGAKPVPGDSTIRSLLACIGSQQLHWQDKKLVKQSPCIQLDPNGIAQGYSVDVLAAFLEQYNIHNYIVELGGEIRVKGRKQPGNEKMSIGIEAPGDDLNNLSLLQKKIWIDEGAITTSGTYRRFYESNGKKISHLLDPRNGYPVQNELITVSVYAKDAITADAYDNAIMLMGLEKGLDFTESNKDIAAFFIYRKPDGTVADTASRQFYKLFKP